MNTAGSAGISFFADDQNPGPSAALEATARGRVFLLAAHTKRPRTGDFGYHRRAMTEADQLRRWFADDPDANYGVIPQPGHFVVDADGGALGHSHRALRRTPVARQKRAATAAPVFHVARPSAHRRLPSQGRARR